jgi:transcriptional regulator with XRE-family HTH domain
MEEIQFIVARNLKRLRKSQKLSLEKVAKLTGVSKTMISQIERGESSPTITTIWKIANGLKVSFTALINHPQPEAKVISKSDIETLSEDDGKYRAYPYFPFEENKRFEFYAIEIDPEGRLDSDGHQEGTVEFIMVFEGELTVHVNGHEYQVKKGDSIKFRADKPHYYLNAGHTMVRLSMIIYYSL